MTAIRVNPGNIVGGITAEIRKRIQGGGLRTILRDQAVVRLKNSGDSVVKYRELWATRNSLGYRAGGTPLIDTGRLRNGLQGHSEPIRGGVRLRLASDVPYAKKHQEGFVNKGPNFIPLTKKASRYKFEGMGFKMMRVSAINAGLKEGKKNDFIILKRDAVVPARPIFNMAPENTRELSNLVASQIGAK